MRHERDKSIKSYETLNLHVTVVGHAAVVFQHKLADAVSIPTTWFLLGPTLRVFFDTICPYMLCGGEKIWVSIVPWSSFVNALDFDPLKNPGKRMIPNYGRPQMLTSCMCTSEVMSTSKGKFLDIGKIAAFEPLMSPQHACGEQFGRLMKEATVGSWTAIYDAYLSMYFNDVDATKRSCIFPPYKTKYLTRLKKLNDEKKLCLTLSKALHV
jgi:hypothetical protein